MTEKRIHAGQKLVDIISKQEITLHSGITIFEAIKYIPNHLNKRVRMFSIK